TIFCRFATFKTPCRITENREERSGQEKEGQEKEEIGACPASPRGEMSLGDSSRRTLFTFFIPLIPFHLPANPVCELQRFGIPADLTAEFDRRRSRGHWAAPLRASDQRVLRDANRWKVESNADMTGDSKERGMQATMTVDQENVRSPIEATNGRLDSGKFAVC